MHIDPSFNAGILSYVSKLLHVLLFYIQYFPNIFLYELIYGYVSNFIVLLTYLLLLLDYL